MTEEKPVPESIHLSFKSSGKAFSESKYLAELAKLSKAGPKLKTALLYSLKSFGPHNGEVILDGKVEGLKLPSADMVFLTLVGICNQPYAGKFEKIAWSVGFKYKGTLFTFSLQKFGLRLYCDKLAANRLELCREMLGALAKGMEIVAKLMEPVVIDQVSQGNVTLANAFHKLDNMYSYFRDQAEVNYKKEKKSGAIKKIEDIGKAMTASLQRESAGGYNTMAMIDSYFSRLEHLLVILLAFTDYDRKKHNLVSIMSGLWSDKFKTIFNLEKNPAAKALYNRLSELRELYRNPVAHGNFHKNGKSLFFHLGKIGPVSCHLSNADERMFSIFVATKEDFERACALFDEVDAFLKEGITHYGFLYAEAGLNVAYDPKTLAKYRTAMADEESFNSFLEHESYMHDQYANMDW